MYESRNVLGLLADGTRKDTILRFSPFTDTNKALVYELQCDESSQPLTVSSSGTLCLLMKVNRPINLKSVEIILPSGDSGEGELLSSSKNEIESGIKKISLKTGDLKIFLNPYLTGENSINLFSVAQNLSSGNAFISVPLGTISNKVGKSEIKLRVRYASLEQSESLIEEETIFSFGKFPNGFSLTNFKAGKISDSSEQFEYYSGERFFVSWKIVDQSNSVGEKIELKLNCNRKDTDVTSLAIDGGDCQQGIVIETDETQGYPIELTARLKSKPEVEQKYFLSMPITVKPAEIKSLIISSPSLLENGKVPIGDSVHLSWELCGKVSRYELDVGAKDPVKLSGEISSYDDEKPQYSKTYKLKAFLPNGKTLPVKMAKLALIQPAFKPKKLNTGTDYITAIVGTPEGKIVYMGMNNKVIIVDTFENNITEQIDVVGCVKALALSENQEFLYVGCEPSSVYVISTNDKKILAKRDLNATKPIQGFLLKKGEKPELYILTQKTIFSFNCTNFNHNVLLQNENDFMHFFSGPDESLFYVIKERQSYSLKKIHPTTKQDISITLSNFLPKCVDVDNQGKLWFITKEGGLRSQDSYSDIKNGFNNAESITFVSDFLCIAHSFNNAVHIQHIKQLSDDAHNFDTISVGLHPRKLILNPDKKYMYVLCSNGVYAIATKEIVLTLKSSEDIKHSPPGWTDRPINTEDNTKTAAADAVTNKFNNAVDEMIKNDEMLASSPFGVFASPVGSVANTPFSLFLPSRPDEMNSNITKINIKDSRPKDKEEISSSSSRSDTKPGSSK